MREAPTISVIIPAFNNAHALRACLDSVLSQTAAAQQVIVADDASTDATCAVTRSYGDAVTLVERDGNGGAGAARNSGLEQATGEFVAFLDADDRWAPAFLERTVAFLMAHPTCVAVSTAGCVKRGRRPDRMVPAHPWPMSVAEELDDFFAFWAAHDHVRTGTVLMRRAAVQQVGGQRAELRTSQDLEFWACLATLGPWGFIPEALWMGNSYAAGQRAGWSMKHRTRWRTCPSVEMWEARLRPLIRPEQATALDVVRGRVAAGYAYMMTAGGDWRRARATIETYGAHMPRNRVVRLQCAATRAGRVPWVLLCTLLYLRERGKGRRLGLMADLRIAWVTRSFLDYRIPVFKALDQQCGGGLDLFYSADYVPERVQQGVRDVLGSRAHGLRGEWRLGREDRQFMANRNLSLRLQPGLGSLLHQCAPDVMVCDGFAKWTVHALAERRHHETPLVIAYEKTRHTERRAQWVRKWYRRFVVRHTDAMACNGSLCAEYATALGMPAERITTGQMAADTSAFAEAAAVVTPAEIEAFRRRHAVDGLLYLQVGRLTSLKGCRELIEAWARFDRRQGAATLVFAGEGPMADELKAACARHRLDSVRFTGAIPYADMPVVYAAADLLVSATLEDNWSLVVPEAMACGVAVLCSRYNGCWPELVEDDINGWVFDPLDAEAFQAALHRPLAAAARLADMGQQSQRMVQAFSPERAAASILSACQMAVKHQRRPGA